MNLDWDEEIADKVDDEIWEALTSNEQTVARERARLMEQSGRLCFPVLDNETRHTRFLQEVYRLREMKFEK